MTAMEPIVSLDAMELIANGIDRAEGIGLTRRAAGSTSTARLTGTPPFYPTLDQIGG